MRLRAQGALVALTVVALCDVLRVGGAAVTVLLSVAALGAAAVFVFVGYAWGRDDRVRARKVARRW